MQFNRIYYFSLFLLLSIPAYPMGNKAQNTLSQRALRLEIVKKLLKEKNIKVYPFLSGGPGVAVVLDVAKEPSNLTTAAQIAGILATGTVGVAITTTAPFLGAAAAGGAAIGGLWWFFGPSLTADVVAAVNSNKQDRFFGPGEPFDCVNPPCAYLENKSKETSTLHQTIAPTFSDTIVDPVTQFIVNPNTARYKELDDLRRKPVVGFQSTTVVVQQSVIFAMPPSNDNEPKDKKPKKNEKADFKVDWEVEEFEIEEQIMDTVNEAVADLAPTSIPKTTYVPARTTVPFRPSGRRHLPEVDTTKPVVYANAWTKKTSLRPTDRTTKPGTPFRPSCRRHLPEVDTTKPVIYGSSWAKSSDVRSSKRE